MTKMVPGLSYLTNIVNGLAGKPNLLHWGMVADVVVRHPTSKTGKIIVVQLEMLC